MRLLSFSAVIDGVSASLLNDLQIVYPYTIGLPGFPEPDMYQVIVDISAGFPTSDRPELLGYLEEQIDTAALDHLSSHVIVHAGVIFRNGCVIVIPATSGAGKSTLVAAASLSGFSYLSDEVAIIDVTTRFVRPFSKAICLKPGGWDTIRESFYDLQASVGLIRPDGSQSRFLVPPCMQQASASHPVTHVIIPVRQRGARAALTPLTRFQGLAELVRHSINLPRHGPEGFIALAALADSVTCAALVYDDIGEAVSALIDLTGG